MRKFSNPRVISAGRTYTDGRFITTFYASFRGLFAASKDELAKLQNELGYHPAGYGGPTQIVQSENTENGYLDITWSCSGNCD